MSMKVRRQLSLYYTHTRCGVYRPTAVALGRAVDPCNAVNGANRAVSMANCTTNWLLTVHSAV